MDQAYVTTPDGLKVEILEDKKQSVPIRHEHVHFFLPESAIAQSQAWYAKTFGAKPGVRNEAAVADLPGVQLRFAKTATPTVTTKRIFCATMAGLSHGEKKPATLPRAGRLKRRSTPSIMADTIAATTKTKAAGG